MLLEPGTNMELGVAVMAENNVTTGVRGRVVGRTIENVKAKQPELSNEFLEELHKLLAADKVPKADVYLQLFDKQVVGDS
jgi:hypothetical protein